MSRSFSTPHRDKAASQLHPNASVVTSGEKFFHPSFKPVNTNCVPFIQIETAIGVDAASTNLTERNAPVLISDSDFDHPLVIQQALTAT